MNQEKFIVKNVHLQEGIQINMISGAKQTAIMTGRKGIGYMTIDEAIKNEREIVEKKLKEFKIHYDQDMYEAKKLVKCADYHEKIASCLEELKELREYKRKMEMQYLDDINNPLEPLKLASALRSEIFKYDYRKKNKPDEINVLDYTVMYALKHCLEEQLKDGDEE